LYSDLDPVTIFLPTTISFAKIIGCTVYMCKPMSYAGSALAALSVLSKKLYGGATDISFISEEECCSPG